MIDYKFQGRLNYIPGGALNVQMSAWPAAVSGFDKTGLVAWWSLDETSGTRNDSHGTNHLADGNTVLYGTGKISNAADFEATNSEYLYLADNAALSMGDIDFTLVAWVKFESSTADMIVLSKYDYGASQREYQVLVNASNRVFLYVSGNGTTTAYDSATGPIDGEWGFVVCWHDATANTINVQVNNGTPSSTSYSGGVLDGTATFAIGSRFNNGTPDAFFDGLIDEVSIWKRVLTADERTWLFNSGNGRSYSEL